MEEARVRWDGVCVDDGTGRNVYYVSPDGQVRQTIAADTVSCCYFNFTIIFTQSSRNEPEGYTPACFETGERKYYFRGNCVRCRNAMKQSVLSKNKSMIVYSFNLCENCLLATTPGIGKLRGNGGAICLDKIRDGYRSHGPDVVKRHVQFTDVLVGGHMRC